MANKTVLDNAVTNVYIIAESSLGQKLEAGKLEAG